MENSTSNHSVQLPPHNLKTQSINSKQKEVSETSLAEDQIRAKAHELWIQRGDKSSAEDNWKDAIRMLKRSQRIEQVVMPIRRFWWWTSLGPPFQQFWQWLGVKEKTGWDFAQLLAAPVVLLLLGWGLQQYAEARDQEQQRVDKEREQSIADDKAQQDTLVKYLDQMAESLNGGLLEAEPGSNEFIVAQVRTVIALQSLDRDRHRLVIQFLSAAGLNQASHNVDPEDFDSRNLPDDDRVLLLQAQLKKAELANSDLSEAVLIGANLERANLGCDPPKSADPSQCSDLSRVDFREANLESANLSNADLWGAFFSNAFLIKANLSNADLTYADLTYADLYKANLSSANLSDANLTYADLWGADLSAVNFSDANLRAANLLQANLSSANLSKTNLDEAILLATDLRTIQNLTLEQLENNSPFLCHVALPPGIAVNPDRDCDRLPQILLDRPRSEFETLEDAENYVNKLRQQTWEE